MEARKRRRTASEVGGGRVGEGESPVASTSAPLDSIAPLFADLRALCEERAKDAGPGVGGPVWRYSTAGWRAPARD